MIPFNRPYFTGREGDSINEAFRSGHVSGDGVFSRRCQAFFESRYGMLKGLLTTSCTDALEMAALLCDVQPGDEVILPSYTFVSTANAFALRGAKLRFVDSLPDHPNMDPTQIAPLISNKTKAIVPVHYAGVACDMDIILGLASSQGVRVVEDAAQAIESSYKGRPLGTLGDLATFSFHETKNVHCGEGGLLSINNPSLIGRAEIIREKGTNRSAFFRGEVDKYGWVDLGSSYLPSDLLAAMLWVQLEELGDIQAHRMSQWKRYAEGLADLAAAGVAMLPHIPRFATHNAHAFYLVLPNQDARERLIRHLKADGIMAVFHYQSLHRSPFFKDQYRGPDLPQSDRYSDCLVRLPLFYRLEPIEQERIMDLIRGFFGI